MPTISTRIANLEKKLIPPPCKHCTCPDGGVYQTCPPDMTEAEFAQALPDNPRYCPVCGGLLPVDELATRWELFL